MVLPFRVSFRRLLLLEALVIAFVILDRTNWAREPDLRRNLDLRLWGGRSVSLSDADAG